MGTVAGVGTVTGVGTAAGEDKVGGVNFWSGPVQGERERQSTSAHVIVASGGEESKESKLIHYHFQVSEVLKLLCCKLHETNFYLSCYKLCTL